MSVGSELEIGASSALGKCEGDLESAITALFPGAETAKLEGGIVSHVFAGTFGEGPSGAYMGAVLDYRGVRNNSYRGFDVGISVTGPSASVRQEVIEKLVERAQITLIGVGVVEAAGNTYGSPNGQ